MPVVIGRLHKACVRVVACVLKLEEAEQLAFGCALR